MADASIFTSHMQCYWSLLKFWGRDLISNRMTNAKGFALSVFTLGVTTRVLRNGISYYGWILQPMACTLWYFAAYGYVVELFGLSFRFTTHCADFYYNRRDVILRQIADAYKERFESHSHSHSQ